MNLSLCMIVKDEAARLAQCLRSVQGVVDEVVLVDTGSTDGTPDIAAEFGARVFTYPWTGDFAAARNHSLEQARGRWILVLDADEELPPEMKPVVAQLIEDEHVDGYLVQIISAVGDQAQPETESSVNLRLFRNLPGYRFSGRLHEQVAMNILQTKPDARLIDGGLQIRHWGYLDQVVAEQGKHDRNLGLARSQVAETPDDAFARFNLGIELQRHGDFKEALAEFATAYALHAPGAYWTSKLVKCYVIALSRLGRQQEALALIEGELPRHANFTDLVFLKGVVLSELARHEEAAACFQTCLEMGPAPVPPYSGVEAALGGHKAAHALGQQYETLQRFEDAVAAYTDALGRQPTWIAPLHRAGAILLTQGGVAAVRAYVQQQAGVGHTAAVLLADILARARRYDLALTALEEEFLPHSPAAGAQEPRTADEAAAYLRSRCLLKLGRYEEAIASALLVPASSPHGRAALVNHVFCLWMQGKEAEVGRVMRRKGLGARFRQEVAELFLEEAEEVLIEGLRRFPEATLLQEALTSVRGGARP